MPIFSSNAPFNPNPISKILAVFLTGLTVVHSINIGFEIAIVCLIGILFYLNGYKKHFLNGSFYAGYFTPCLILWCYLN